MMKWLKRWYYSTVKTVRCKYCKKKITNKEYIDNFQYCATCFSDCEILTVGEALKKYSGIKINWGYCLSGYIGDPKSVEETKQKLDSSLL